MAACSARVFVLLCAALLALGLAGCASPKKVWYKPGMSQDQWAVDSASCRSRAQYLAERELATRPESEPAGVDSGGAYDAMMSRHSAKRGMEELYRRCLESMGYKLVEPAPANKA